MRRDLLILLGIGAVCGLYYAVSGNGIVAGVAAVVLVLAWVVGASA
jgi:hypothetical protein